MPNDEVVRYSQADCRWLCGWINYQIHSLTSGQIRYKYVSNKRREAIFQIFKPYVSEKYEDQSVC